MKKKSGFREVARDAAKKEGVPVGKKKKKAKYVPPWMKKDRVKGGYR